MKAPVLVVHGSEDRLIPPFLGRSLYEQAHEPKRFVLVDGVASLMTAAAPQRIERLLAIEALGRRLADAGVVDTIRERTGAAEEE